MTKNIEWLKKEVELELQKAVSERDKRWSAMSEYSQGGCIGRVKGYKQLLNLINQLDEPDLPVIPEDVHEFIGDVKDRFTLSSLVAEVYCKSAIEGVKELSDVEEWVLENLEAFAEAWRTGEYEVEQEPKYRVKLLPSENGYLNRRENAFFVSDERHSDKYQTEFTEQEIKDINPLYWSFKEPVKNKEDER